MVALCGPRHDIYFKMVIRGYKTALHMLQLVCSMGLPGQWEKRHEDPLRGRFTNRQGRKDVPWPGICTDFADWEPKKKRKKVGRIWVHWDV